MSDMVRNVYCGIWEFKCGKNLKFSDECDGSKPYRLAFSNVM